MNIDFDSTVRIVNSLMIASRIIFYFAVMAGIFTLLWIRFAKKYNQSRYQRLVNIGGIYILSLLIAEFVIPWILRF